MDEILIHERKRKWFVWGTFLTCTLSIPLIVGMSNSLRGISAEKATGLAAVAGGLAEAYVTFAAILAFALPIAAIFLLSRSLSQDARRARFFPCSVSAGMQLCLLLLDYSSGSIWCTCPRCSLLDSNSSDQEFDSTRVNGHEILVSFDKRAGAEWSAWTQMFHAGFPISERIAYTERRNDARGHSSDCSVFDVVSTGRIRGVYGLLPPIGRASTPALS
jgi:hypothetical protein